MNNKNNAVAIGLLKNLVVCLYDLLLLFSILFFLSLPFALYFDNQSFGDNIKSGVTDLKDSIINWIKHDLPQNEQIRNMAVETPENSKLREEYKRNIEICKRCQDKLNTLTNQ